MNIQDINISNTSSQVEPEIRNESIRKVQAASTKTNLPVSEEINPNKDEQKDKPDKFIQSAKNVASAVYNVRDIGSSRRENAQSQTNKSKKVLDMILPMGRKRLRIFLEGE